MVKKEIRNSSFWQYVPMFVKKQIIITNIEDDEDYQIIGYFPYHTARIRQRLHKCYTIVPRSFLVGFEEILIKHHINDNKAVYICE
jgi:hypothetical protein